MQMTGQVMWKSQDKLHIKTLCYIKLTLRFSLLLTVPSKDFFKFFYLLISYCLQDFFFKVAHRQSAKHVITFYCNTWDDSRPFLTKYISFTASSFLLAHLLKKPKKSKMLKYYSRRHLALVFSFIVFFFFLFISFYGGVDFSWSSLLGLRGLTKWFSCSLKIKHKCRDYFE